MLNSMKKEFYKFYRQKIPLYGIIALAILMIYTCLTSNNNSFLISSGFGSTQWIIIILITISSSFVSLEYQDNTIINLLYKNSNKWKIYLAKFVVLSVYCLVLIFFALIFTLSLIVIIGDHFSLLLIKELFFNVFGTFIYSGFIISMAFMLISLLKNNTLVIVIGLLIGFLGAPISNSIISTLNFFKWNPLNIIYITNQLSELTVSHISKLSNVQIVLAALLYTLIFLIIGYKLFKRRRV